MAYTVDNAIIMAAGTSSRFAPLSYERPKALIEVRGEVLIERQIRQLQQAGVSSIYIVTGYKAEQFAYLRDKFGVQLVHNDAYLTRNNHSSIYAVKDVLASSYICSADNYFAENPFEAQVEDSYYAALFAPGPTKEWCMTADETGTVIDVRVGGEDAWYMLGHAFWSVDFTRRFLPILEEMYHQPGTVDMFWESIYMEHLDQLKLKLRKYPDGVIFEFDSLDELREFDASYIEDTRSGILRSIAAGLGCTQGQIRDIKPCKKADNTAAGIRFSVGSRKYIYEYETKELREEIYA